MGICAGGLVLFFNQGADVETQIQVFTFVSITLSIVFSIGLYHDAKKREEKKREEEEEEKAKDEALTNAMIREYLEKKSKEENNQE